MSFCEANRRTLTQRSNISPTFSTYYKITPHKIKLVNSHRLTRTWNFWLALKLDRQNYCAPRLRRMAPSNHISFLILITCSAGSLCLFWWAIVFYWKKYTVTVIFAYVSRAIWNNQFQHRGFYFLLNSNDSFNFGLYQRLLCMRKGLSCPSASIARRQQRDTSRRAL